METAKCYLSTDNLPYGIGSESPSNPPTHIITYTIQKIGECQHISKTVDTSEVLTSYPPQYKWKCDACDKIGFIFCSEIRS